LPCRRHGVIIYRRGIKSAKHAVYDIKYHIVWIPKYRKEILTKEIQERLKEIFQEIAKQYEFEIEAMEIMTEHVHIFLSAPPRYAPSQIVNILKGISSRKMFEEFPWLTQYLWAGEFWSDGYFVRTVGDRVTSELIRRYIKYGIPFLRIQNIGINCIMLTDIK
jgi:putative transposase